MTLEESSQPGDTVVETNSLRFLVAERDQQAVDGVQVDFTHNWLLGSISTATPTICTKDRRARLLDILY